MKNSTRKISMSISTILLPSTLVVICLFSGCSHDPFSCNQELQDQYNDENATETASLAKTTAAKAQTYTLSITTDGHGTVKPSSIQTLYPGQSINITATSSSGYVFNRWTIVSGSAKITNATSAATTVQLVTGNTVIKATFARNWSRLDIKVGMSPVGVLYDGTNIWVADENGEDIYKILASTGAVLKVYRGGHGAQYLAYDNVRSNVWVTNPGSNNITVINAVTGKLVTYASGGNCPDGIVFDGTSMWVANYTSGTVTRIRASDGVILKTITAGTANISHPRLLAYDKVANKIWVTVCGDNKVKKIDPVTNQVVGVYSVSGFPYAIAFDGTCMWVTQGTTNTVVKMRTTDGAILATYNAGIAPNGIAFDGTYIWITNQVAAGVPFPMNTVCTVTQIRASNGAAVETYRVGARPQWVTTGGGYVWVTNGSDNTVSRCIYR